MVLWASILILQGASLVGSSTGIPGGPENITVMFLNPTSVRVSWSTSQLEQVEKYDVAYKPTDARSHNSRYIYRVVAVVAGNSEAVTLNNLHADTQYQLIVTAVKQGKKFRSRPIVFRTLEPPRTSPQQDSSVTGVPIPPPPPSVNQPKTYLTVRGIEVGIVVVVLIFWAGAIALFFNRWGKIRMLLPYQPDYKQEQLKVPGTGVPNPIPNNSQHTCSQHLHWSNHHVDSEESQTATNWPKTTRPRVNSAIDVAGFLSQEFLRRHGSTSRLCRKVRSADNLPLSSRQNSEQRDSHEDGSTDENGDRESFLKSNQDDSEEKSDDTETGPRQNSLDLAKNLDNFTDHQPLSFQTQSSRDTSSSIISKKATSLKGAKRFAGWRSAAITNNSRDYVRCPINSQSTSIDER